MSTFRLQLIACHSTFLTVLIEKDNQSLQPENTFSRKRFHTQLQKYLLAHRYSNQLRTAFRTRARLVCHLVFNAMRSISISVVRREFFFFLLYFLYVRIESCHFVSRWTPERHIRNCSFKREMKISRLNLYFLFSDLSWEFSFVYRKPEKKTIFHAFCCFQHSR
jgi:hypothetical protein